MKIAMAGVGGIGSNVAMMLVQSGIDEIQLVDFDRVEASNLNRQFYFADQIGFLKVEMLAENLRRINPGVKITCIAEQITAENLNLIFADYHCIVEGLDQSEGKKMLIEGCCREGKKVVAACGIAGSDTDTIRVQQLANCTIIGDFTSDCADHRLYAHKVMTVAAKMTESILSMKNF